MLLPARDILSACMFILTRRPPVLFLALFTLAGFLLAAELPQYDPLPATVSNNAVAAMHSRGELQLFTFMGIGAKKTWDSVTNDAYVLSTETGKWAQARSVPGPAGRLAAGAVPARDHIFLFGGYAIDGQGGEHTLPDVNVYEPIGDRWSRAADIPIPVDDFVIGVRRDRFIYLIGGWSKDHPINDVQVYDAEKNVWMKATPMPGTAVFGHSGSMAGDTIVYVDGAYPNPTGNPKFIASDECWMGKVNKKDPTSIEWTRLPAHPGPARYRTAAGGSEKDDRIYFSGGTDNPYNYNGIGYDGKPSQPSPFTFDFNTKTAKWEVINDKTPNPTMDHRGLIVASHSLILIGGMNASQEPTAKVVLIPKQPSK
jgi:N-acetylneuraminic acid mutarotase